MTRPIDADILKEAINTWDKFACLPNGILEPFRNLEHPEMFEPYIHFRDVIKAIDNAPTIPLPDFKEGYKQAIRDGKTNFSSPQGEWITFGDEVKVYVNKHCSISVQKYRCSECNGIIRIPKDYLVTYKICPQCGAKMFKEKVKENELQSL